MVAARTSSIPAMDTVDSQNATRAVWAALAAATSARWANIPARPTGARITGIDRSWPSTVVRNDSSDTSRSTR